jgi:hypothetical protein
MIVEFKTGRSPYGHRPIARRQDRAMDRSRQLKKAAGV